ncbi:MAG: hypothetical protein IJN47_00620, partial [Clostridia bacterium]|nr:hypothetical protein [Clostridia bacterium]
MKKKIFVIMIVMATLIIIMGAYQIHRIPDRPESYFEKAHRVSAEVPPAPPPLVDLSPSLSKQQAQA